MSEFISYISALDGACLSLGEEEQQLLCFRCSVYIEVSMRRRNCIQRPLCIWALFVVSSCFSMWNMFIFLHDEFLVSSSLQDRSTQDTLYFHTLKSSSSPKHTSSPLTSWIDLYANKSFSIISEASDLEKKSIDEDVLKNREFCSLMVNWMWNEVIPARFNHEFRAALMAQRRRHEAVASGRPYSGQKYIVWSLSGGLGNRFQSLASVLAAAMLSGRVLLMKDWFTPLRSSRSTPLRPTLLPFARSLNSQTEAFRYENLRELFWFSNGERTSRTLNENMVCGLFPMMSLTEFEKMYPGEFRSPENSSNKDVLLFKNGHAKIDIRANHDKKLKLWNQFACGESGVDSELDFFSDQRFVYIWTNQYFLPLLYANRRTGPLIKSWIPEHPFRSFLLLIFLPAKPVMYRVLQFYLREDVHLKVRSYTGLHVRSLKRHGAASLIRDFSRCVKSIVSGSSNVEYFFLASMYRSAIDLFNDFQLKKGTRCFTTLDNKTIGEQSTGQGAVHEWNALADVVVLSLSNALLLSPGSTFGFLAAAVGEIENLIFVMSRSSVGMQDNACLRKNGSIVTEPCFTSWFKLDAIGTRRHLLKCTLSQMPLWAHDCGTKI